MNYQNFETHVDSEILQRGQNYFALELVKDLKIEGESWRAKVFGSQPYSVFIEGESDIESWRCTCPFDQGPVCKHVVAVLYAIQDRNFEDMMRNKNT